MTSALVWCPRQDHIGHHVIDPHWFLFDGVWEKLSEICKKNGIIFISVNSFESKNYSKITNVQDISIKYKTKNIFYHLFKESELKDLLSSLDCKIIEIIHECSNWRIVIEKM